MLISSEITGICLWRSSLNPATSSSTWCWFQIAVAIKQETGDYFFDLATVSGVFGKYAKKLKLVVWLVQGIRLVKFTVDTLELFLELCANGRARYAKTPRVPGGNRGV